MKKRRRTDLQKEKIIMLTASVFVLTALTMTGLYVKEKNENNTDGYVVDFSKIEEQAQENTPSKISNEIRANDALTNELANNDLDVDPGFKEANSGKVEIPGVTAQSDADMVKKEEDNSQKEESNDDEENDSDAKETNAQVKNYTFDEKENLQWPVVGNILLNYSMDKTIYFPTMEEYKYNPAIVIAAVKNEPIVAASDGYIKEIFSNEEIGKAITIDLGSGYELTYGQLEDITVSKGENIAKGQIVGYVAEPTKYYSLEGSNIYFKMTKDEAAVNPMTKLQ